MPDFTLSLPDLQATERLGHQLGRIACNCDVILLHGNLGVGKTTLTQAIATGIGTPPDQYVTSPSFALLHEYPGRIPLYHMDCYRLSGEDDVEGAGLADYIGGSGLTVIEWPDRLGSLVPELRLDIELQAIADTERSCILRPRGALWMERIKQMLSE